MRMKNIILIAFLVVLAGIVWLILGFVYAKKHPLHQEIRHKIQKGETLYSIARKHGTTVDALCKLNRIQKSVKLKPGRVLRY